MKNSDFKLGVSRKNHKKRYLVIFCALGLVILLVLGGAFILHRRQQEQQQVAQKARDEAQTDSAKNTRDVPSKSDFGSSQGLPDNSSSLTTDQVPAGNGYVVVIDPTVQANHTVTASASVGNLSNAATCVFTFSNPDSRPVVRQLSSQSPSGSQRCNTSIPEVEFTRLGTWNLNVTFYINGTKVEANQDVTIQ